MPKVSVIVPVYKVEPYLCRCIDSVLNQTFTDFELILVDDGSPDGCGAICDEYAAKDPRVRVIHKENGGVSSARNAGLDAARGQWLSFVDSDDYIHRQTLEVLLNAVLTTGTQISSCGFLRTQGEPVSPAEIPIAELREPADYYQKQCVEATVTWGKLYHRDCFRSIRYPLGKLHEDEFVTYRILFAQSQLAVIPAPLYGYYQNPNGIMGKWSPQRLDVLEALYEQMLLFQSLKESKLMQNRMGMFNNFVQIYLKEIGDNPNQTIQKECMRRCQFWTRKMLQLYQCWSRYDLLDYQELYELIYPSWLIKVFCNGWKFMSGIKQGLKGR